MDMITLAMAKAYTDSKTSGGGSGGGLPVVELETALNVDGNEVSLSAKDQAALDTIGGSPCIIKFPISVDGGDIPASTFLSTFYAEGAMAVYTAFFSMGDGMAQVSFANYFDGTGWFCAVSGGQT